MAHQLHVLSLEVLRVQEDDIGAYAKIKVTTMDGEAVIRWGLDDYTFHHLKGLVFTQGLDFQDGNSVHYRCLLSTEGVFDNTYPNTGWLECYLGTHQTRLSFPCSDLYTSNLQWLLQVESLDDLEGLRWNKWLEYHFNQPDKETPSEVASAVLAAAESTAAAAATATLGANRRKRRRPLYYVLLLLLIVVLGMSWYVWQVHAATDLTTPHRLSLVRDDGPLTASEPQHALAPIPPVATKSLSPAPLTPPPADTHPMEENQSLPTSVLNDMSYSQVYKVAPGYVALTFDDGPSAYTQQIIDTLAHYGVHATFFFISNNAKHRPDEVRDALLHGDVVGSHSVDHKDMTKLSKGQQDMEVSQSVNELEAITGQPVTLFRPPYGAINQTTKDVVRSEHMVMCLWNRDPRDWAAKTPTEILETMLQSHPSGGVFDLHDNKNTMLALPRIIEELQKQHLTFVVLGPKSQQVNLYTPPSPQQSIGSDGN